MILWWIGNIVFLFVVIPVVVILLRSLRDPVIEIDRYASDALEHGVLAIANLDAVDQLATTREHARQINQQLTQYGQALDQIL